MNLMQATQEARRTHGALAQTPSSQPTIVVTGTDGKPVTLVIPQTHEEMQQLMSRRSQLSDQLDNVTDRRNDIVDRIRSAPNVAEAGLTAQLKVLNDRIVQLETDLAVTGRQIAAASPDVMSMAEEPSRPDDENGSFQDGVGAGVAGSVVVATIMLFLFRRRLRRTGVGRNPQLAADATPRLARLEQGMDAIAIEVERISEGQRFVTKLLSEAHGAPAPVQRGGDPTTLNPRDQPR